MIANQGPLQHSPSSATAAKQSPGRLLQVRDLNMIDGHRLLAFWVVNCDGPVALLITGKVSSYGEQRGGLGCFLSKTWEQSWSPGGMQISCCWEGLIGLLRSRAELLDESTCFIVVGLDEEICREGEHDSSISSVVQCRSSL